MNTYPSLSHCFLKVFQELSYLSSLNIYLTITAVICIFASGIAFIIEIYKEPAKISNYKLYIYIILMVIFSFNLFILISKVLTIIILAAILTVLFVIYEFYKLRSQSN